MLNLFGVVISFIVIIILNRKKYNFGLSLIIGSLILGIFSLHEIDPIDIPKTISRALLYDIDKSIFDFQTIELATLLTLIYVLAKCMQETGAINKVIRSLRTFFYKGGILGIIPAIYGLMPVPGGALFSAPLIDKEGQKFKLKQNQKYFLNVWFRHIWFPIFPVSSAMMLIIGSDFANINIYEIIIADIPAFVSFILIGYVFLRFYINKIPGSGKEPIKEYKGLIYLLPPIVPIITYIIFFIIFEIISFQNIKIFQRSIFVLGVIISIILLYFIINIEWRKYVNLIKKSLSLNLAFAIIGIMIFRQMIETSKSNEIIAEMISSLPFPAIFILIIIPLIMGLITGYNFGAIALSYFLVEPFFIYTNINIVGIVSLIFISSLVGYLISPIHLCNVVSSDCLKTDTTRMYKMYIPAIIALLIIQTSFIIIFYGV
jgi:integral membrane protein (TIGR00529 family)